MAFEDFWLHFFGCHNGQRQDVTIERHRIPISSDEGALHQGRQDVPHPSALPAKPGSQGEHRLQNRQIYGARNHQV